MKYKVYFASNARRVTEADHYAVDDKLLVFTRDGQPVLTCTLANVNCWFVDDDEPQHLPLAAQCGCASVSA
jgi:hypothetical protein